MNDETFLFRDADVLIVDDVPENLDVLIDILKDTGCVVRPVTRAETAWRAALRKTPDAVLLDIHLPDMDGPTLCAKFKEHDQLSAVPVIFISGSTGQEEVRKAFAAGGADYIVKPFQAEEVLARLRTQLELRRLRLELERYKTKFGAL